MLTVRASVSEFSIGFGVSERLTIGILAFGTTVMLVSVTRLRMQNGNRLSATLSSVSSSGGLISVGLYLRVL